MKQFYVFLLLLTASTAAKAQVKVGDNAKSIHPSAALEVESKTKGFLPPRMSRDSMHLIVTPAVGLVVYNTTDSSLFIKQPNGWVPLSTGRQVWASADSNHIYNLNGGNVGIGITNPFSKLQINGDLKLQKGANVNEISTDSTFAASSDSMLVTEKAIKAYLKSGKFIGGNNVPAGGNTIAPAGTTGQNLDGPQSIAVQGNYAYVASYNNSQLSIYDISNPNAIVPKAATGQNLDGPQSIAVQGNYAYVASANNDRLCIYDISDPNKIVPMDTTGQYLDFPQSVAVQGNYAYVASAINDRLCIYDVSDPNAIVPKDTTDKYLDDPQSIAVQGNYAYVVSYNNNQLSIYDISNPDVIVPKTATSQNLSEPYSVAVQGNFAYVASSLNNRLCIFDISNPNVIVPNATTGQNLIFPVAVTVKGNYAYVTSFSTNQLCIYDISNPAPGGIVTKATINQTLDGPSSVAVQGNYVYVTSYIKNNLSAFQYTIAPAIPVASGDSLIYSNVLTDYATTTSLSNYASKDTLANFTTASSLSNYATVSSLSNYAPISNPSFQGDVTYTGTLNVGLQYLKDQTNMAPNSLGYFAKGCPTGYSAIGGGGGPYAVDANAKGIVINYNGPDPQVANNWRVFMNNTTGNTVTVVYYVVCAKVK